MIKRLLILSTLVALTSCSTIKQYWPRAHDPVMFNQLVATDIAITHVDCEKPDWRFAQESAEQLAQYAEWRHDPQAENLIGLKAHTDRMANGGSKMFCELGKKTANGRIEAAKSAWEGR